jgi:molecular chaperone GrpE
VTERSEKPRIRVTDKRRFAGEVEGGAGPDSMSGSASAQPPAVEPTPADGAPDTGDDLEAARVKAEEYLGHLQRLQAEFDNYRKRVLKEQTRAVELAAEPVIRRLLEVVDDFELALMAANDKPDFDRFLHGVELVFAKFLDALKAEGLARIEADGKPFDPERHEALMQSGDGDGEPMVADVLRPGYTLRGRVLRPAGVRVERT